MNSRSKIQKNWPQSCLPVWACVAQNTLLDWPGDLACRIISWVLKPSVALAVHEPYHAAFVLNCSHRVFSSAPFSAFNATEECHGYRQTPRVLLKAWTPQVKACLPISLGPLCSAWSGKEAATPIPSKEWVKVWTGKIGADTFYREITCSAKRCQGVPASEISRELLATQILGFPSYWLNQKKCGWTLRNWTWNKIPSDSYTHIHIWEMGRSWQSPGGFVITGVYLFVLMPLQDCKLPKVLMTFPHWRIPGILSGPVHADVCTLVNVC